MGAEGVKKEACVQTREEVERAAAGDAFRVELCSQLDKGGFTPSADLVEYARSLGLRVAAMVRRSEGFILRPGELPALLDDVRKMAAAGADALVFGYLDVNGAPDAAALKALMAASDGCAGKREFVFHMAFDEVPSDRSLDALEAVAALGFSRILTKGGAGKAEENMEALRRLALWAHGKTAILCGGGVTDANCERISAFTGIMEFHGRKLGMRAA